MTYIDNSITVLFYTYFLFWNDDNNNDTNEDADEHYHHHSYSNPDYSTSTKLTWKAKTKYEIIT